MKAKNLMLGEICKIVYERISLEEYYPSSFDERGNFAKNIGESIFYKHNNYAYDLINFRRYKIVKDAVFYPDERINKKVVILRKPFSDISDQETVSRKEAIITYQKTRKN